MNSGHNKENLWVVEQQFQIYFATKHAKVPDKFPKMIKCQSLVGLSCPLELADSAVLKDPSGDIFKALSMKIGVRV